MPLIHFERVEWECKGEEGLDCGTFRTTFGFFIEQNVTFLVFGMWHIKKETPANKCRFYTWYCSEVNWKFSWNLSICSIWQMSGNERDTTSVQMRLRWQYFTRKWNHQSMLQMDQWWFLQYLMALALRKRKKPWKRKLWLMREKRVGLIWAAGILSQQNLSSWDFKTH